MRLTLEPASSVKVVIRCAAIQKGRVGVQFTAVFPVKTNPAPINASTIIKINETNAIFLTESPFTNLRKAQMNKSKLK